MGENIDKSKNDKPETIKITTTDNQEPEQTADTPNFLDYIFEFLDNKSLIESISNAIDSWSKNKPVITKYSYRAAIYSLFFGIAVLAAIGIFGYLHIISKDVTGSLLGALIGYWYGQQKQNKK